MQLRHSPRRWRDRGKPIARGGVEAIVNNPELRGPGIDVDAGAHADALEDPVRVAAVRLAHQLDLVRGALSEPRVSADERPGLRLDDLAAHVLPHQAWREALPGQVALKGVVATLLSLRGKVGQRLSALTTQQIRAVVQAGDGWFRYLSQVFPLPDTLSSGDFKVSFA